MEDTMDSYDEQEETSTLRHHRATESNPTEWTDEKHSLYLKSMEATFVDQLNKSLNLFGRHVQKSGQSGTKSSTKHKHNSLCAPSGQFKVLRDGRWSKTDLRRDEAEISQKETLLANPWIQHYRCSERQANWKVLTSRAKDALPTTANQYSAQNFQFWRRDSVASNAEVTDQNFIEEDLGEDKSNKIHEIKITRASSDSVPSNDQVVPFENIARVDDVAEDRSHPDD